MGNKKEEQSLEIINKETGEVFELPEILRPIEAGQTFWSGENIDIRAMLKDHTGHFSVGGQMPLGKSLEFFLLNSENFDNIRPSRAYERPANFTQFIAFLKVGDFYTFATITFGGVSHANARDFLPLLALQGGGAKNIVKATVENQTNDRAQKFGVVKFELRPATVEEIQRLEQAYRAFPQALTRFNPLPNVE